MDDIDRADQPSAQSSLNPPAAAVLPRIVLFTHLKEGPRHLLQAKYSIPPAKKHPIFRFLPQKICFSLQKKRPEESSQPFSVYNLFREGLSKLHASDLRLRIWRFIADCEFTGQHRAVRQALFFPIAHPFAVAPAIGAE